MCVTAGEMLPQGAQIELSFTTIGLEPTLQVKGTVVWSHASGRAGIQFVKSGHEPEEVFEAWLRSVLPTAPGVSAINFNADDLQLRSRQTPTAYRPAAQFHISKDRMRDTPLP